MREPLSPTERRRDAAAGWLVRLWGGEAALVGRAYGRCLDPAGADARRVLSDLARLCMAAETSVVPGDPQGTAFNEGKRAVWLHLQAMLALEPETVESVMKETLR